MLELKRKVVELVNEAANKLDVKDDNVVIACVRKAFHQRLDPADSTEHSFDLYDQQEGHPDWKLLSAEAAEVAERLVDTLEAPRTWTEDLPRKLSSCTTVALNYLLNQQRRLEGRQDFLPLYFIWTLLRNCNFQCSYCDDHRGTSYPEKTSSQLNTEDAKDVLRVMRTRTPSVYFCGGEPTIRKDLPKLVREARDLKYYPLILNTNGSILDKRLQEPEWKTLLADIDMIVVSIDGLDVETMMSMWQTNESGVQNVFRNLLMLHKLRDRYGFKLLVNTVIQPGNSRLASEVLDFANDLGITFCPVPENEEASIAPGLLEDPEYLRLVANILERKRQGYPIVGSQEMNEMLLLAKDHHCYNSLKPHIDEKGQLLWPCSAEVNIPNQRFSVLDYPDLDSLYAHASSRMDVTNLHGNCDDQCGGNCNRAQHFTTDRYYKGLLDPKVLIREASDFLK